MAWSLRLLLRKCVSILLIISVRNGNRVGRRVFWLECTVLLNNRIDGCLESPEFPDLADAGVARYSHHTDTTGNLNISASRSSRLVSYASNRDEVDLVRGVSGLDLLLYIRTLPLANTIEAKKLEVRSVPYCSEVGRDCEGVGS